MNEIDSEKLEKLLEIIPDHPAVRLVRFCDETQDVMPSLATFAHRKSYEYTLNCLTQESFEAFQAQYRNDETIKTVRFFLQRPVYALQGKLYDFVFVTAAIEPSMREAFVAKLHPAIKNGGNVLFFIPKGDYEARCEWMRYLDEHYYVATNTIDDLFDDYDVLISRKMHGWGG